MSTTRSKPIAFFETDLPVVKGRQLGFAMTSKEPNHCVTCIVTCEDQWSIMQMEALEKMGEDVKGEIGLIFIEDAVRRAKRAAGNYAQLFLDDEGTDKEGRFYWPGLAAFAAKQVADGLVIADGIIDGKSRSVFGAARFAAAVTYYYLAKGNLWLFLEVVPWHLFYRQYGARSFNHCGERRNFETYDAPVKAMIEPLPWAKGPDEDLVKRLRKRALLGNFDHPISSPPLKDGAALAEMNNCRMTEHLRQAFEYIEEYEQTGDLQHKQESAYNAAWASLQHEQEQHLQRMVYDHPEFRSALGKNDWARGIPVLGWLLGATDPTLFFHSEPTVDDEIYERDVAPYGITLEEITARMEAHEGPLYDSLERMKYAKQILDKYHKLMTGIVGVDGKPPQREYIVEQIRVISDRWRYA
ncbi:DUF2515 family protein [Trinickia sp.]|uniref:DUF2515 family protein n=1 Tax=Trinickia sp. TaxID=2571163 RepID=UPI003F807B4E